MTGGSMKPANNGAVRGGYTHDYNLSPTQNIANALNQAGESIEMPNKPKFKQGEEITFLNNVGSWIGTSHKANKERRNAATNAGNICSSINYHADVQHNDANRALLGHAALAEYHEKEEGMRHQQRMDLHRELVGKTNEILEKCADKQVQAIGGLTTVVGNINDTMVKEHEKNREQDSRQHQELVTLKTRLAELNRQTMERGFIVQRELAHERQVFDRELMVQRREMAQAHDNTNREIAQMQIAAQNQNGILDRELKQAKQTLMREGQMVTQMQGREMIRAKERANEIAQQHLDLLRMQFFMGQNGQHSADSEESEFSELGAASSSAGVRSAIAPRFHRRRFH